MADNIPSIIWASTLITIGRGGLFFACRKHLIRNLYHDLQNLSSPHEADYVFISGDDIELENHETLPPPTPSTPRTQHERPLHSVLARSTFALCFSEVCTLFVLIMCEGAGLFSASARLVNWRFSLFTLLTTILVLVPLSFSVVINFGNISGRALMRPSPFKVLMTLAPIGLYIWLFSFIPIPPGLPSADYIMISLARLTVIGTLILGLLSGLGATQSIWGLLKPTLPIPTEQHLAENERSVMRVREDIRNKKGELQRLQDSEPPDQDKSWLSRVVSNVRGDSPAFGLAKEIEALEALDYNMTRDWQAQIERRDEAHRQQTVLGGLLYLSRRAFAVYCIVRILSSIYNVLFGSSRTQKSASLDMIPLLLAKVIAFAPSLHLSNEDIASISKAVSFVAVGALILSSLRVVLRGVTRLLRVTSRSLGASCMLFVLAQLMGIYLLSTLVQLSTLLPSTTPGDVLEGSDANLLSTLPHYQIVGAHFDWALLLSAVVSLGVRWFGNLITS